MKFDIVHQIIFLWSVGVRLIILFFTGIATWRITTLILHTIILISTGVVQTKELGVEERQYIFRKVLEKGLVFIMHKC